MRLRENKAMHGTSWIQIPSQITAVNFLRSKYQSHTDHTAFLPPYNSISGHPHCSLPSLRFLHSYLRSIVMNDVDTKPLLSSKLSNYTDAANSHQRRRRASANPSSGRPSPGRAQSFSRDFGHAAAETYLVTRLTFTLLRYLGVGYRWMTRLAALGCYALLLMPGFLQVAYYYFFSSQVRRSIVYGEQPRNRLDLYLPANSDEPKPVVIFVTGGAWIIGYKAWGSLLGQQLAERDIIVACIDYRNFPQGTISDMVKDASQGISFICNHIAEWGGDPNRIYLMGQSAGAHISACALLEQAINESEYGKRESISWSVSQIKTYFGLSGGYNLLNLVDHFHNRGLYRSIFLSIMEGEQSLQEFSPELKIQDSSIRDAVSHLPHFILFHGTSDYSIPADASITFVDALQRAGVQAKLVLFEGKTHTDLFLHDPLRGGKDELFDQLVAVIHAGDKEALSKDAMAPPRRRLVPEFLLQLARKISPF
ncbi:probable isoprenylcysteine alpha-carbonyl methylesterase ICMEL2 [Juglans microcarpa x Juglans regia]|uniref:probable isoprenylcysteine alpha-carbonyl methylesterase ICMEL2 n=1 Tax=Juglans microcarpa x Juglans regia TaxID=2249226 RepID=UPI001B7E0CC1|nr:probable isoprenylcysteine alpha-carbonyl methylesterase ICMEL2 [Juglans microcarpa x Juglans regia]